MAWSAPTLLTTATANDFITIPAGGVAAGTTLIVGFCDTAHTTGTYTVTDTHSGSTNVYSQSLYQSSGVGVDIVVCRVTTALVSGDVINATWSGGGWAGNWIAATATGGTTTLDGSPSGANNGGGVSVSSWVGATMNPTQSGDLAICLNDTGNVTSDTPVSGWTDLTYIFSSGNGNGLLFQYQVLSGTGSVHAGGTYGSSGWAINNTILLEASGGGGSPAIAPQIISGHSTYF